MRKIILASSSPRRKEILRKTGLKFEVHDSGYEELLTSSMPPQALAKELSLGKARAAAAKYKDAIVIAADTFIVFKGSMLGKPHTAKEAIRMLKTLNGNAHTVITGVTILDTRDGRTISRAARTKVYFRRLTLEEIESYVNTGEPLDKAGGYAIQGLGACLVRRIEGDFFNVVGLPLALLAEMLKKFGIPLLPLPRSR